MAKNNMNRLVWFLAPVAIAINFLGNTVCSMLGLPVYLDSIGTTIVGALCGPVPGLIVGGLSNVIQTFATPWSIYYAPVSMAIGLFAGLLSRKGFVTTWWKIVILGIINAILGGGVGTVITWIVYGWSIPASSTAVMGVAISKIIHIGDFPGYFIASCVKDILDKMVAIFISAGIIKAIPIRFLAKLPQGNLFIKQEKVAE